MKQKFTMPTGDIVEKEMPMWKTPYNHDTNFESDRTALYCADPSLTKQEFKDEADINVILERFMRTREAPPITTPEDFTDLTGRTTYYDMASRVAEANKLFYELPATKRYIFQNDPTRWADAVVQATEAGDRDAMIELGLDVPPAPPTPLQPTNATGSPPAPVAVGNGPPGAVNTPSGAPVDQAKPGDSKT